VSLSHLVDVIVWLDRILERVGARRSFGGAIAYSFWGPMRFTNDVDVLVLVPDSRVPALVEALTDAGCLHGDSKKPIDLREILADLRGKSHLARFWKDGVRIEVFVPWHPFHHRVLERSPERELEGHKIRIHSAEDLIVFKKVFDRPKDITDIRAMLLTQRGKIDLERIRQDARQFLSDESWRELDRLLSENG
jgi:nucleotidyltransferase DUF2204